MQYLVSLILILALAPTFAQPTPQSSYETAMQAGKTADAKGQPGQAIAAYRQAVTEAEAQPDHPEWLIQSLLKYADVTARCGNEGRYQRAEELFTRALAVAMKAYGKDDLRLIEPLTALGWFLWEQQQYPAAEDHLTKALAIAKQTLPADSVKLADARFELGAFYKWRQSPAGIAYLRQALAGYEKAYGPEHRRTLITHMFLGDCLLSDKQYHEAQAQYQSAVEVYARIKPGGWEHSEALAKLSSVYIAQQQYDKAEPLELQVFAYAEKLMGANSMSMINYLHPMIKFYQDAGKPEKAEPYVQRLIALHAKSKFPQTSLATAHESYAKLLVTLKRPAEAKTEYLAAYDLYERWLALNTHTNPATRVTTIPQFFHDQVQDYLGFLTRDAAFQHEQGDQPEADRLTHRAAEVEELLTRSKAIIGGK